MCTYVCVLSHCAVVWHFVYHISSCQFASFLSEFGIIYQNIFGARLYNVLLSQYATPPKTETKCFVCWKKRSFVLTLYDFRIFIKKCTSHGTVHERSMLCASYYKLIFMYDIHFSSIVYCFHSCILRAKIYM